MAKPPPSMQELLQQAQEQQKQAKPETKKISLALQGGGSHGAYTWGVLDRILAERNLEIEAVSGTSAGAMNAAAMSHGFLQAGRDGGSYMLEHFWKKVSDAANGSPLQPSWMDRMVSQWNMDYSPAYMMYDMMTRLVAPEQLNPGALEPLKEILAEEFDFEAIRRASPIKIYVTATNLTTGKAKIFTNEELTPDMLLASACLPSLFAPVEIDGEHYWDGGYVGNPSIFPLIYDCEARDIILVQINPIARPHLPGTAREIIDRVNEISFNATLMREMRSIATVSRMLDEGHLPEAMYRRIYIHIIEAEEEMADLSPSSKLNAEWEFLQHLHDIGYAAADRWLAAHGSKIGRESSVDVFEMFV